MLAQYQLARCSFLWPLCLGVTFSWFWNDQRRNLISVLPERSGQTNKQGAKKYRNKRCFVSSWSLICTKYLNRIIFFKTEGDSRWAQTSKTLCSKFSQYQFLHTHTCKAVPGGYDITFVYMVLLSVYSFGCCARVGGISNPFFGLSNIRKTSFLSAAVKLIWHQHCLFPSWSLFCSQCIDNIINLQMHGDSRWGRPFEMHYTRYMSLSSILVSTFWLLSTYSCMAPPQLSYRIFILGTLLCNFRTWKLVSINIQNHQYLSRDGWQETEDFWRLLIDE